jgi:hypothetical protein
MNLEGKLAELNAMQDDYRCDADLTIDGIAINEKTMTTIIAATGVGKSTINKRLLELAARQGIDAGEPGTETTRPRRADDGDSYRTDVTHDEMISRINNSEYPNWSITPSGHIYATPPESLSAEHNFLPCLPSSLPMLRRAGFKAINAFYIVTTAEAWDNQIETRKGLADFPGRIEEAKSSLEFAWGDKKLQYIFSAPGENNLRNTAQLILDFATGDQLQKNRINNQMRSADMHTNFMQHSHEMYNWAFVLSNKFDPPSA